MKIVIMFLYSVTFCGMLWFGLAAILVDDSNADNTTVSALLAGQNIKLIIWKREKCVSIELLVLAGSC